MLAIYLLSFLFAVSQSLYCPSGQVYVKFTKKTASWGSEESWEVFSAGSRIYSSPTLQNNDERVIETCLTGSTNSQYTLKMHDSYGDSWSNGAWLQIEGVNGNRVLKRTMFDSRDEELPLSLYAPINKNDSWRLTSGSITGSWTAYNYSDMYWFQVILGSVTAAVSGTQYFRKTFTGLAGMAAYEASFNYRYGIIAYINGMEIYRDNMPQGAASGSTIATGSYPSVNYHAVIRPGVEVATSQSVLAVEIHFLSSGQDYVDFDSYLAIYARSVMSNDPCYVYPYDITLSASNDLSSVGNMRDFSKSTSFVVPGSSLYPVYVTFTLSGPRSFVNGVSVWPYTNPAMAPHSYILQGKNTDVTTWTNAITVSDLLYENNVYTNSFGYFYTKLYSNYRIQLNQPTSTSEVHIYETDLLTCSLAIPTSIEFEQTSFSFYTKYQAVTIQPIVKEFTSCFITPSLPSGLSFDSITCTISGSATTASTNQYTISSVMNGQTYTGSFTLQFFECTGTILKPTREYAGNAAFEGFNIVDATTQNPIVVVNPNSGQINNQEWSTVVCVTGSKYIATVTSSNYNYWQAASFLYINAMLDSNGNYETLLRVKYDVNLGLPTSYTFNAQFAVKSFESWYYKMGVVPSYWYSSANTASWSMGTAGTFPNSSNQIQLYKKIFTVASLDNVAGLVVSFKYQYGFIIYLNNHEVARKGFTGDLSTSTYSSTSLSTCKYRQISLPIKTMGDGTTASVDYIVLGSNTIAIGLIAAGPAQTTANFDAAVRLMGTESVSRVWKVSTGYNNISGSPSTIMDFYHGYTMYYSTCSNNYVSFTFDDDRREWISSVVFKLQDQQNTQQPRNVIIKAKNSEDSEWTTLETVTGMTWSLAGQANKIWLTNSKAYNQYRFENFATGDTTECYWKLGMIDLRSDATRMTVPALTYPTVTSIFKDIEIAEIYPSSTYYYDYTSTPALPTGLYLDPYTGTISGMVRVITTIQSYTISAKKFNTGETVTAQLSLTVEVCTGDKSLITLVARADSSPEQSSWKLYQGKEAVGTPIQSVDQLPMASALSYGDFCLNHGIYTLEFKDTSTGWGNPAGYYLTVDVGEMKFEMGYVYSDGASPVTVTTMFSSYLPFQIEYDVWKVFKGSDVAENWNSIDFNDSMWTLTKADAIGTNEAIVTYIRREVIIPAIADYHVLNVRVRYTGGVVAYFNGRKVARFNLDDGFDDLTESLVVRNSTDFSKFHIILNTVGAVTGKNIMAFEIHRPVNQSSSEPVVFDATGVFGVNDCSIGVDSIINVSGTPGTTIGDLENFFDLTPVTYGYQSNSLSTYLQWTVENLEGTRFNSFALQTIYSRTSWGFSLYGREIESLEEEDPDAEEYYSMFAEVGLSVVTRGRSAWDVPVGIAGFRQFRHEIDDTASSTVYISAYIFQYCKVSGDTICAGIGDYPPVYNGQISTADCGYGYRGYSYRECADGTLGPIKTDKCILKPPMRLRYTNETYVTYTRVENMTIIPRYQHIVTRFYLANNATLPAGLSFNEATGAITGIAEEEGDMQQFTICGENAVETTCTTIGIHVLMGIPLPPSNLSYPVLVEGWMNTNTSLFGTESTPIGECKLCTFTHIDGNIHGFSVDPSTGHVSGVCTSKNVARRGEYTSVTIHAENESGSANVTLHIACYGPPEPFDYSRRSYFIWVNQNFTSAAPTNSSYSWYNITSGKLPEGLTMNPITGEIQGTPTEVIVALVEIMQVNPAGYVAEYVHFFVYDLKVLIYVALFIVFVVSILLGFCIHWMSGLKINKKRGRRIMPIQRLEDIA